MLKSGKCTISYLVSVGHDKTCYGRIVNQPGGENIEWFNRTFAKNFRLWGRFRAGYSRLDKVDPACFIRKVNMVPGYQPGWFRLQDDSSSSSSSESSSASSSSFSPSSSSSSSSSSSDADEDVSRSLCSILRAQFQCDPLVNVPKKQKLSTSSDSIAPVEMPPILLPPVESELDRCREEINLIINGLQTKSRELEQAFKRLCPD